MIVEILVGGGLLSSSFLGGLYATKKGRHLANRLSEKGDYAEFREPTKKIKTRREYDFFAKRRDRKEAKRINKALGGIRCKESDSFSSVLEQLANLYDINYYTLRPKEDESYEKSKRNYLKLVYEDGKPVIYLKSSIASRINTTAALYLIAHHILNLGPIGFDFLRDGRDLPRYKRRRITYFLRKLLKPSHSACYYLDSPLWNDLVHPEDI